MLNRVMLFLGLGAILILLIPFAVQARDLSINERQTLNSQFLIVKEFTQKQEALIPSINLGGGLSDLDDQPLREMPVNIVLSGTILITDYPPLGTMVITTTQRLSGTFPPNPYFYPCPDASGLTFSSTGGMCTWDPNAERIYCPTGITSFTFSYACTSVPPVTASNLSLSLTSDWGGGGLIDRTWDLTYTPLTYASASIPPDFDTGQMLHWTQIDEANLALDLSFIDPRVQVLFLPGVYK